MDNTEASITSANLDHHGLVAAACRDLDIAGRINKRIGSDDVRRVVQPGVAVVAMILNGLGFTNRRLYLTPQFFQSKPVERLLGEKTTAEQVDDHALGKALDEIAAYGATKLFGEIAFEIAQHNGLLGPDAHLDTTSFSVHGKYETSGGSAYENQTANADAGDEPAVVEITHGYSKDHRPDLRQIILSLTVTGGANIPVWMEPTSGNAADKKTFQETVSRVRAFQQQLKDAPDFTWIGDSALYVPEKLLSQDNMRWVTRVPETVGACRDLVSLSDETFSWTDADDGYKFTEVFSSYGGIPQRWLLVSSAQAYEREKKTFLRKVTSQEEELRKAIWHLGNQVFKCSDDATVAIAALKKKYRYHHIQYEVVAEMKHARRGRPAVGDEAQAVGYRIISTLYRDDEACRVHLQRKGRFVLATNDLANSIAARDLLVRYKEQQSVEGGFRFLKDPWFMIDSFFLKSSRRIEALMMVMTLCLLVYNFAQFRLRKMLHETQQTVPNQLGKPTKKPTLRWIFQIMEGISVVHMRDKIGGVIRSFTTNIDALRMKIIRLFGPTSCLIYGIPQTIAGT